jgi:hypothetical protein
MKHPINRIWNPHHDPAYDFRVIAEFAQRFPHLQFVSFYRNPQFHQFGVLHSISFRTDRAGLRTVGIPRPKHGQNYGNDYRPGYGPPTYHWRIDARCRLPYVVGFWMMDEGFDCTAARCLPESHPFGWLVPSRLESTPFAGDLDSIVWGDTLRIAA